MEELALKRRLNTYLYRGYPGILSIFENGAKQLAAQLKNGVADKKKCVVRRDFAPFNFRAGTHFFYKQPHFPVEPRVAIGSAQNEAQNCYEVANVFW